MKRSAWGWKVATMLTSSLALWGWFGPGREGPPAEVHEAEAGVSYGLGPTSPSSELQELRQRLRRSDDSDEISAVSWALAKGYGAVAVPDLISKSSERLSVLAPLAFIDTDEAIAVVLAHARSQTLAEHGIRALAHSKRDDVWALLGEWARSARGVRRVASIEAITATGRPEAEALLLELTELAGTEAERESLVRALLRVGGPKPRAAALRLARSGASEVAETYLKSLTAPLSQAEVAWIEKSLDGMQDVQLEALGACGRLRVSSLHDSIVDLGQHGLPKVRAAAVGALLSMGPEQLEEALEIFRTADEDAIEEMADHVGRLAGPRGMETIVEMVIDGHSQAATLLDRIPEGDTRSQLAAKVFLSLSRGQQVQSRALQLVEGSEDLDVLAELSDLATAGPLNARQEVLKTLASLDSPEALDELILLASSGRESVPALMLLVEKDRSARTQALIEQALDEGWTDLSSIVQRLPKAEARELFLRELRSGVPDRATEAIGAAGLVEIDDGAAESLAAVASEMSHPGHAIGVLAKEHPDAATQLLVYSIEQGKSGLSGAVEDLLIFHPGSHGERVVDALLGGDAESRFMLAEVAQDMASRRGARRALGRLIEDPDPIVARRAMRSLRFLGSEGIDMLASAAHSLPTSLGTFAMAYGSASGDERFVPLAVEAIASEDQERVALGLAASEFMDSSVDGALESLASDPSRGYELRQRAIDQLERRGLDVEALQERLYEELDAMEEEGEEEEFLADQEELAP